MKKVSLLLVFLSVQLSGMTQSYCPTPGEYSDKLTDYQTRAMKLLEGGGSSLEAAQALYDEQDRYIKSVLPSCIEYFKVPKSDYDCKKLQTVGATFMMLDDDEQTKAKLQINKLPYQVKQQCTYQYDAMRSVVDGMKK